LKYIFTILFSITSFWSGFMKIHYQNQHIDQAYENYFNNEYEETISHISMLEDSLEFFNEGLLLNKAHSYYKLARFDAPGAIPAPEDSIYRQKVQNVMGNYAQVLDYSSDLASVAYNQSGVVIFKSGVINGQAVDQEQMISTSIEYFKNALIKDPLNEEARYNYELLKKYKAFPDQIFKTVETLVKQRKYEQAYQILAPWVEKDSRFKDKKEYTQRLGEIVQIEKNIGS